MRKNGLTVKGCESVRDHLFDRVHRTGEEIKNDFPNSLRWAIKNQVWKRFRNSQGKPFKDLVSWLHHAFPNGVSMGAGRYAITYEEALKLTEGCSDVHRVLAENAPKGTPGRKGNGLVDRPILDRRQGRSGSRCVLSVRLAQEKKKFYEAYLSGNYRSVTAAAIAAGLIKGDGNMRRLKSAYRKSTAQERKEFKKWMKTKDAQNPVKRL